MSEEMNRRKNVWLRMRKVCAREGTEEKGGGELLDFSSHFI